MNILTKEFSLGDVLSITTGKLVSERHMDGIYDILNWMTGDDVFSHQIPRAANVCCPALARQFPQLDPKNNPKLMFEIGMLVEMLKSPSGKDKPEFLILGWLSHLKRQYDFADTYQVAPLTAGEWMYKDPVAEAGEMFGADNVITISTPPDESFPANIDTGETDVKWESELTI